MKLGIAPMKLGNMPWPAGPLISDFKLTYNPRGQVLAHELARFRCTDCALERLVPFSCKGRGFCPSCGGRRMTECAARLVDEVLPRAPVRQWVLSLPYRCSPCTHACCSAFSAIGRAAMGSATGGRDR